MKQISLTRGARGARTALAVAAALVIVAAMANAGERIATADFRLKSLDGHTVSLHESLAEGPVLIAFWATWCKPCLQELPKLSEMAGAWSERGLTVQAISIDKTRSHGRVRSYVRSQDFAFDVLLDPNQEAFRKLQATSVPFLVLLDGTGETRFAKVGYRPGDERAIAAAVEDLLGGAGEVPAGSTGGASGDPSDESSEESPGDAPGGAPGDAPDESPGDAPRASPQKAPDEESGG